MAISSNASRTTTFTTTTTANWELRTAAAGRCKVLEFSYINSSAATATTIGLGRPQAIGITPVNVLFQRDDPADPASVTNISLSWATSPTVPLIYHRRWGSAATQGVGVVWTFPRGLVVPISSSLVCWNIAVTTGSDVNCVIDE